MNRGRAICLRLDFGSLEENMNAVRILVVDDHDLMRRGIKSLLQAHPGWEICGEAHTGREAVQKAENSDPMS